MPDTATLKPLELHIENEQKFISYLINKNPEDCLSISEDYFINKTLKIIFISIKNLITKNVQVTLDTLLDSCKQKDQSITYDQLLTIKNFFTEFETIDYVKERLKQNYLKQVQSKQIIEQLLVNTTSSGDLSIEEIKKLSSNLQETILEIEGDENTILFYEDLIKYYKDILQRRREGVRYTLGVPWLDSKLTYPAEPGDMLTYCQRKGEGKTTLGLNLANAQVNKGIPVIYFCFDMGYITIMDRTLCMREGFIQEDLKMIDTTREFEGKLRRALNSLEGIPNFILYPRASISLDDLDPYLYKCEKAFRDKGFMKNDTYAILYFDTIDMIEDFSGADAYGIKKGINKLHGILRKHGQFAFNLAQLNESQIRAKRPKELSDVDNLRFTKEDIEGGASYASRSRVVLIGSRANAMKKSFFPQEEELIDLDEDLLKIHIDKQNDGELTRIVPLVFDSINYRVYPHKERGR